MHSKLKIQIENTVRMFFLDQPDEWCQNWYEEHQ